MRHPRSEHDGDGPCGGCEPEPFDPTREQPRALERAAFVANVKAILALPPMTDADRVKVKRAVRVEVGNLLDRRVMRVYDARIEIDGGLTLVVGPRGNHVEVVPWVADLPEWWTTLAAVL